MQQCLCKPPGLRPQRRGLCKQHLGVVRVAGFDRPQRSQGWPRRQRLAQRTLALQTPTGRPLSLRQRWKFLKQDVDRRLDEVAKRLRATVFVSTILHVLAILREKAEPAVALYRTRRDHLATWWDVRLTRYDEFLGEETKREWRWKRRHEKEWETWRHLFYNTIVVLLLLTYEAITPASVLWATLPPVFVAWVWYDTWWWSPVGLVLFLVMPLKFLPGILVRFLGG